MLDLISFTTRSIEKDLKKMSLKFPSENKKVQEKVEKMKFPFFNKAFYDFIKKNNKLPSQTEFFNHYLSVNSEKKINFKNKKNKLKDIPSDYRNALKVRLFKRVYPSLVRDIHFNVLFSETSLFENKFSFELDNKLGIDSLINNKFAVHLFFYSRSSNFYRNKKKKYRHNYYDNQFTNIELPINPFGFDIYFSDFDFSGKEVGQFYLYSEDEINYLEEEILNLEDTI